MGARTTATMGAKTGAAASVSRASMLWTDAMTAARTCAIMAAKLTGCGYCLGPALYAQYQADVDTLSKVAGWGFVVIAAIAFKYGLYSLRQRHWGEAAAALGLWLGLAILSMINAAGSISATGAGARVHHASVKNGEKLRDELRTQLRTQRTQQAKIIRGDGPEEAGEASFEVLKLTLQRVEQAAAVQDNSRWQKTRGCAPGFVTVGKSDKFCEPVLKARETLAAAKERDRIGEELKPLDKAVMAVAMPKPKADEDEGQDKDDERHGDPEAFASNVIHALVLLGYDVREEHRPLIHAAREWGQAAGIELQATVGPAIVIGFIDIFMVLFGPAKNQPAPVRASVASKPASMRKGWFWRLWRRQEKPAVPAPAQPAATDATASVAPEPAAVASKPVKGKLKKDIEHVAALMPGFLATLDTSDPKAEIEPTPAWEAFKAHCLTMDVDPTTQKAFGTVFPRHFQLIGVKEKRRRYVGVKIKPAASVAPAAPAIRLAVNNR
jgi:hypothetical protein